MAVSNKTIIALALLAIAVAVVAESQGTFKLCTVCHTTRLSCAAARGRRPAANPKPLST